MNFSFLSSSETKFSAQLIWIIKAILFSLAIGGSLTWLAGFSPFRMITTLLSSGFGCNRSPYCAFLTTLQFATPLIFAGLSAAIALRIGFFSIGQAGQMVLGAGFAAWVGYQIFPTSLHPIIAILMAALIGAIWGILPVMLKQFFEIHEIISSFILNSVAGISIGLIPLRWGRIEESAQFPSLGTGTKLNYGIFIGIIACLGIYYLLWHMRIGFRQRMVGNSPKFAKYGGININWSIYGAMMISGALAGIGGAIEVLGVHYKFITGFSADSNFDGIMVALLAQGHPLGVFFAAIFIGGIRLGSLNGLLIKEGIPRELGNMILAIMMIFLAIKKISQETSKQ